MLLTRDFKGPQHNNFDLEYLQWRNIFKSNIEEKMLKIMFLSIWYHKQIHLTAPIRIEIRNQSLKRSFTDT